MHYGKVTTKMISLACCYVFKNRKISIDRVLDQWKIHFHLAFSNFKTWQRLSGFKIAFSLERSCWFWIYKEQVPHARENPWLAFCGNIFGVMSVSGTSQKSIKSIEHGTRIRTVFAMYFWLVKAKQNAVIWLLPSFF